MKTACDNEPPIGTLLRYFNMFDHARHHHYLHNACVHILANPKQNKFHRFADYVSSAVDVTSLVTDFMRLNFGKSNLPVERMRSCRTVVGVCRDFYPSTRRQLLPLPLVQRTSTRNTSNLQNTTWRD
jgi:hypothetical protein